jgi:hypothetical protein
MEEILLKSMQDPSNLAPGEERGLSPTDEPLGSGTFPNGGTGILFSQPLIQKAATKCLGSRVLQQVDQNPCRLKDSGYGH